MLEQWFEHCPNSQAKQKTGPAEFLYKALALLIAVLLIPSFITAAPQEHEPVEQTHESSPSTSLPMEGGCELQVWVAGAPILSVDGSSNDGNHIIELGARYGWILTDVHGPGVLRGQFEYAVDVMPLFAVAQENGTSYCFTFNAFSLKWNFQPHGHFVPYADLSGGGLITDHGVPPGSATFNFTGELAGGVHYVRGKNAWSLALGVFHISNGAA